MVGMTEGIGDDVIVVGMTGGGFTIWGQATSQEGTEPFDRARLP